MRASKKTAQCHAGAYAYSRLPFVSLCEAHLGISKAVPATSSEAVGVDMGDCSPEFQGRRRAERRRAAIGRGKIDYALYFNSGLFSATLTSSANFFRA